MRQKMMRTMLGACAIAFAISAGTAVVCVNAEEPAAGTEPSVLTMETGASVRRTAPAGIRFQTYISAEDYNEITTQYAEAVFGTMIIPTSLLKGAEITAENFDTVKADAVCIEAVNWLADTTTETGTVKSYVGVLVGKDNGDGTFEDFPAAFYNCELTAVSYCEYNDEAGTVILADNPQTRSIAYVASAYLADNDEDTNGYLTQVVGSVVKSLTIDGNFTMTPEETKQLTVSGNEGLVVKYISSNDEVATVSAEGVVTAVSVGETTITASVGDVKAEVTVTVERPAPEANEIELFGDPSSVENVRLESGADYTPVYLSAGNEKLPEGAKGGVEFAIPDAEKGTWPRFYINSRIEGSVIDQFRTVSFDLYLDAPTYDGKVLVKLFPDVSESDYYAETNKWVTISVSAQTFAANLGNVGLNGTGLFWVQNGDDNTSKNAIDYIRIANIRAEGLAPKANEIELFGDEGSLDNISVSAGQPVNWTNVLPEGKEGGAALVTVDPAQDLWLDITVKARQGAETYRALQAEGYNAVTMEVYLKAAEGTTSRVAQMNYWAQQGDYASQGSIAIGSWVKLTFDLDKYLELLGSSSDGGVKLLWIASFGDKKVSEIYIRNVQVEKVTDAVSFADGTDGFFLLDSPENVPSYAYVAAGDESIPAGLAGGAVKMSFAAGAESWPNLKFGADKSLISRYTKISLRIYIKAAEGTDKVTLNLLPDGGINDTVEVETNKWVTVEISVEDMLAEYNKSNFNGILYTNLFWFTNTNGNTVSEFWISGMTLVK